MPDPEPEPLVPETVDVPPDAVTKKTVERAKKVLQYVSDAMGKVEPDEVPDKALAILEEMRDGIKTLNEKLDRSGGIVPAADLTPAEKRIRAVAAAGGKSTLLDRLDALYAE